MEYSSRLVEQLPTVLRDKLRSTDGFSGEVELGFDIALRAGEIHFQSSANVRNGRLLHPLVPYPLDRIECDVYCKNDLLQLREGSARSGDADVQFNCDVGGFGPRAPLVATLKVQNLSLDDRLYKALPGPIQEHWNRMQVSGVVDASAAVEFDGQRWNPRLLVRAKTGGWIPSSSRIPCGISKATFFTKTG